jgi:hypothetical protein
MRSLDGLYVMDRDRLRHFTCDERKTDSSHARIQDIIRGIFKKYLPNVCERQGGGDLKSVINCTKTFSFDRCV